MTPFAGPEKQAPTKKSTTEAAIVPRPSRLWVNSQPQGATKQISFLFLFQNSLFFSSQGSPCSLELFSLLCHGFGGVWQIWKLLVFGEWVFLCPVLPLLVFFWKAKENQPKKTKSYYPYKTPTIPGKEGVKRFKKQGNPPRGKEQGIQQNQGKEGLGAVSRIKQQGREDQGTTVLVSSSRPALAHHGITLWGCEVLGFQLPGWAGLWRRRACGLVPRMWGGSNLLVSGWRKPCFWHNRGPLSPAQKGPFWRKRRKWWICILPTENQGFAPQTPENGENGGCHSGKGLV